jgi:hypothetical protein
MVVWPKPTPTDTAPLQRILFWEHS